MLIKKERNKQMKTKLTIFFVSICLITKVFGYDSIQVLSHTPGFNLVFTKSKEHGYWNVLHEKLLLSNYYLDNFNYSNMQKTTQGLVDLRNNNVIKKIIYNNLFMFKEEKYLSSYYPAELILILWEPPTVLPQQYSKYIHKYFKKILTWDDDLVDNIKYFKFYYPSYKQMIKKIVPYKEKKFCCMIVANKESKYFNEIYSERKKAIQFFDNQKKGSFDLYGWNWEKNGYKNYKGQIPSKINVLKNYKFSICFENTKNIKGYVTEKIFDCFHAGVVPIYFGAPNIADYIPTDCFIDFRKFKNYNDLYFFMKNLSQVEYDIYIKNIRKFLNSEKSKLFSKESFEKNLLKVVLN
jgi:alpha(1,3/1,4) fucosyltransferase